MNEELMVDETNEVLEEENEAPPPDTYALRHPLQFGSEAIEVLSLRGSGRSMIGFKQTMLANGMEFEAYKFAELGLRLAGKPRAVVDKLHPQDVMGLGLAALRFILPGQKTGIAPSQS